MPWVAVHRGSSELQGQHKHALTTHHHAEKTGWDKLPVEVLLHVAAHLSTAKELCLFARISYTTSIAARDEWLWRRLCEDAFAVPRDCNPPSWRQLYAFNHQLLRMCLGQHARGGTGTAYHVGHRGYLRVRVRA